MTALTRGYLAEKTSERWNQPMRRWTDTFATPIQRAILIDHTPMHDALVRDLHEAEVSKAREEQAEERLSNVIDVSVVRVVTHRHARRWWQRK
jgi:hypothetical protein